MVKQWILGACYKVANTLEPEFEIPRNMNHQRAIESIKAQSSKSKATFFWRLIQALSKRDRALLSKYIISANSTSLETVNQTPTNKKGDQ